ncbi:TrkA family potassium uptake protein [Synechococcales cyanobacterium C]|uniref:Trk system potassium uptake protein TrkA n=1 Tax=Petrachloros mirabilis ULC683 TaxID=2781853 RepID=A0A8K2ABR9_9CYAN|nr:TrkA family potassium uptake protein [Petrachloros mirabilis ULC683]
MYVIIGGAGLVGLSLAQKLVDLGHTVAVIDQDPMACHYAREQVGVMAFEGSAVSTQVLLEAGIRKADSLVAVLPSDPLNLALISLAKHYGVLHLVSLMQHRDFAQPLRSAGAEQIISTVDLAVSTMVNAIEYPQVESMMHFEQGQIEILKLSISNQCYVVGRCVAEVAQDRRFPSGTLIVGYQSHPQMDLIIPNGQTLIESGSTVLIATKPGSVHQVVNFIEGCS